MSQGSSIINALKFIFQNPDNLSVLDYSDPDTFKELWEFKQNENRTLIIASHNAPSDLIHNLDGALSQINFNQYFTASSWLAAWRIKNPTSKQKILVIDSSKGPSSTLTSTLKSLFSKESTMFSGSYIIANPKLDEIFNALKNDPAQLTENTCEILKNQILVDLTGDPENHHAISNYLAPFLLGVESEDPKEKSNQYYLSQLLSACGISLSEKNLSPVEVTSTEFEENEQNYHILLVDDQAEQGWASWLAKSLQNSTVKYQTTPEDLLVILKSCFKNNQNPDNPSDLRANFILPEFNQETPTTNPILFLDLRLFSGKFNDEISFYSELLPIINDVNNLKYPAWQNFDSDLFKSTKELVEKKKAIKKESKEHREAITWLPRLISLADMTLPIIIFSSTGKRQLIDPFKPYRNIFTAFEKPRLSELNSHPNAAESIRQSTLSTLHEVFESAKEWLTLRNSIQTLLKKTKDYVTPKPHSETDSDYTPKHYEVYIDESGSSRQEGFRITGLVVGYKDLEHAESIAESMIKDGTSWFGKDKDELVYEKSKKDTPEVLACLKDPIYRHTSTLFCMPITLWASQESNKVCSDVLNPDSLIQSLTGDIIELIIFNLLNFDDVTYRIYGAERKIELPGSQQELNDTSLPSLKNIQDIRDQLNKFEKLQPLLDAVENFQNKFGIAPEDIIINQDKKTIRALYCSIKSAQDYSGITSRVFQTRPYNDQLREISNRISVRFSRLNRNEFASLPNEDRPIHFVADIIPTDATAKPLSLNVTKEWFTPDSPMINLIEGYELSNSLTLGRSLDSKDYPSAVSSILNLTYFFNDSAKQLYACLAKKFSTALQELNGEHLKLALHASAKQKAPELKQIVCTQKISLDHQHWKTYEPQTSLTKIEAACKDHMIIILNKGTTHFSDITAHFIKKSLLEEFNYLKHQEVDIKYYKDDSTDEIFAIIKGDNLGGYSYKRVKYDLNHDLVVRGAKHLHLRMGPLPYTRVDTSNMRIHDSTPTELPEKNFNAKHINDSLAQSIATKKTKSAAKKAPKKTPTKRTSLHGFYVQKFKTKHPSTCVSKYEKSGVSWHNQEGIIVTKTEKIIRVYAIEGIYEGDLEKFKTPGPDDFKSGTIDGPQGKPAPQGKPWFPRTCKDTQSQKDNEREPKPPSLSNDESATRTSETVSTKLLYVGRYEEKEQDIIEQVSSLNLLRGWSIYHESAPLKSWHGKDNNWWLVLKCDQEIGINLADLKQEIGCQFARITMPKMVNPTSIIPSDTPPKGGN